MRISLLKLLLAVGALVLSATVQALGMGGINVTSALGQPLQADIELVAVGKAERDSLVARLAQSEAYKSAGLEYPHGNKFKFQIETRANGEPYLQVSSEQPINDPFVSLLVEMTWPSGKLLREYTFLLDPPGYVPEQPVQSEVQVVAPTGQVEPAEVVAEPVGAAVTGVMPGEQGMPVEAATAPGDCGNGPRHRPVRRLARQREQPARRRAEPRWLRSKSSKLSKKSCLFPQRLNQK